MVNCIVCGQPVPNPPKDERGVQMLPATIHLECARMQRDSLGTSTEPDIITGPFDKLGRFTKFAHWQLMGWSKQCPACAHLEGSDTAVVVDEWHPIEHGQEFTSTIHHPDCPTL